MYLATSFSRHAGLPPPARDVASNISWKNICDSALPHERIEDSLLVKVQTTIERDCTRVRFRDRERQHRKVPPSQAADGRREQRLTNPPRAVLGKNADLGDVADIVADARAEDQADQAFRLAIQRYER